MQTAERSVPEYAQKPLLGFSTWSSQLLDDVPGYGGKHIKPWFNDKEIKEVSDAMKKRLPGYEYINLDSGWCDECDEYGRWIARKDLFPKGLREVSDHLKKNGHKLGVYLLPGVRQDAIGKGCKIKDTQCLLSDVVQSKKEGCGFAGTTYMPDSHDERTEAYYESMAELLNEYGVSFVKLDAVGPGGGTEYFPNQSPDNRSCTAMIYKALRKYNIWVEVSWYIDSTYAKEWSQISNGARIYVDIESYSTKQMTSSHRVIQRITMCERWSAEDVVGSDHGFYVDLDVVLVGMTVNGKCIDGLDNDDVRQTCIGFWAMVSSVFCLGSDPRTIPDKYLAWYNHKEILEIHQSGVMAKPIGLGHVWWNRKQVWWKKLKDGRIYVCLINAHTYPFMLGYSHQVSIEFKDIGLDQAYVKDVWEDKQLGLFKKKYSVSLKSAQSQILLISPA